METAKIEIGSSVLMVGFNITYDPDYVSCVQPWGADPIIEDIRIVSPDPKLQGFFDWFCEQERNEDLVVKKIKDSLEMMPSWREVA